MKSMFTDSKIFEYHAQIAACYFLIKKNKEELEKVHTPIEKLINDCTGYEKNKLRKIKNNLIELLKQIIDCKKKIEADYSYDEKFMNEIINIEKK